jgi:branched-chain amino acid transport system substrate-binding protein
MKLLQSPFLQSVRRTLFLAALAFSTSLFAETGVTANTIIIGQDIDLSGTIAVRMKPLVQAADAYIEQVNKKGGVHGRKIKIVRMDSANKPDKTKENIPVLLDKEGVFAMWAISGTGNVGAALPILTERKVPLIGSTSGADVYYTKLNPYLINLKASYGDEIRRISEHLQRIGIKKIAAINMDNGFGREALKAAQAAAVEHKLELIATAGFKEDGSDADAAVQAIAKAKPQAVLLLTLSGPAPKLLEAYIKTGHQPQFFALSIVATDALYKAVGDRSRGVVVTQTVPLPWDRNLTISREYQQLMASINVKPEDYAVAGMEGYVLARMLVEGLQAAGKNPTRENLIAAFEKMKNKDVGGMKFSFSPTDHNGSDLVDITIIGKNGRLVR